VLCNKLVLLSGEQGQLGLVLAPCHDAGVTALDAPHQHLRQHAKHDVEGNEPNEVSLQKYE